MTTNINEQQTDNRSSKEDDHEEAKFYQYKAFVMGQRGVGCVSTVSQFLLNEEYDAYNMNSLHRGKIVECCKNLLLDGDEYPTALSIDVPWFVYDGWCHFNYQTVHDFVREGQCEGIVVLYSIASRDSLDVALGYIEHIFHLNMSYRKFPAVLVGNKSDLPDEKRQVSFEEGKAYAQEYDIPFFEISAKNGINIEAPFIQICHEIRTERILQDKIYAEKYPNGPPSEHDSEPEPQAEGCCAGCVVA